MKLFYLVLISFTVSQLEGCVNLTKTQSCDPECGSDCSDNKCLQECVGCVVGYCGTYCDVPCIGHCVNSNCKLERSGRTVNCMEGCTKGWFGISCNTECAYACTTACDRMSGECFGLCKSGYYGDSCSDKCNEFCMECNKTTGECITCDVKENCGEKRLLFEKDTDESSPHQGILGKIITMFGLQDLFGYQ